MELGEYWREIVASRVREESGKMCAGKSAESRAMCASLRNR